MSKYNIDMYTYTNLKLNEHSVLQAISNHTAVCNSRPDIKWTKNGEPITAGERHKFVYPDQETAALIISKGNRNIS